MHLHFNTVTPQVTCLGEEGEQLSLIRLGTSGPSTANGDTSEMPNSHLGLGISVLHIEKGEQQCWAWDLFVIFAAGMKSTVKSASS